MRRGLAVLTVFLVLGASGCVGPEEKEPVSTTAPVVSDSLLQQGGWGDKSTEGDKVLDDSFGPVRVVAVTSTEIYYDTELRRDVKADTMGNFDQDLSTFFATRVDFDPELTTIPIISSMVMGEVKDDTQEQFETQLEDAGMVNVRETDKSSLTVDTGETAEVYEYSAEYRFRDIEVPVTDGKTMTIQGDTMRVNGILAIWKHGDDVMAAGGVYPAEDFETSTTTDLTDAITVSVDIDLGLQPQRYRNELVNLIKTVE